MRHWPAHPADRPGKLVHSCVCRVRLGLSAAAAASAPAPAAHAATARFSAAAARLLPLALRGAGLLLPRRRRRAVRKHLAAPAERVSALTTHSAPDLRLSPHVPLRLLRCIGRPCIGRGGRPAHVHLVHAGVGVLRGAEHPICRQVHGVGAPAQHAWPCSAGVGHGRGAVVRCAGGHCAEGRGCMVAA